MKKIISVLIAFSMILNCVCVLASEDFLFDALCEQYFSSECETEYSFSLDSPLKFLDVVGEDFYFLTPVDLRMIAESSFESTEKAVLKYSASEDMKKVTMSVESDVNVPLKVNHALNADVWAKVGMWVETDFSDVNKPVFNVIYKYPFSAKYLVGNYSDFLKNGFNLEAYSKITQKYSDKNEADKINKEFLRILKDNAKIREIKRDKEYKIYIDDAGLKSAVSQLIVMVADIVKNDMPDKYDERYVNDSVDFFENIIADIPLLGADGIQIDILLNEGVLSSVAVNMDVELNIYDIMESIGSDMSEYNRDDWYVDFTAGTKTVFSSVNQPVEIEFPEITDKNSVCMSDPYGFGGYDDRIIISTAYPIKTSAGSIMLPLRDAMSSVGLVDYEISGDSISANADIEKYGFETVTFTIGSDKIVIDGASTQLSQKVVVDESGLVVIPADALEQIMEAEITGVEIGLEKGFFNEIIMEHRSVLTEEPEPEDYISQLVPDYGDYISSYISVSIDGMPVIADGVFYLPAGVVLEKFGYSQITEADGKFIVKNDDEKLKEFTSFELTEGSAAVVINGVSHSMSAPVIAKDGVMYAPVDFLSLIDCTINNINYRFSGNSYSISGYRNKYRVTSSPTSGKYSSYFENVSIRIQEYAVPVSDESGYYLPLRPFMGELMIRDENIKVKDGVITVVADDPASDFELMTIKGNSVNIDGKEYTMKSSAKEVEGGWYVPAELFEIFDGKLFYVRARYGENCWTEYYGTRKNPLYVSEDETVVDVK